MDVSKNYSFIQNGKVALPSNLTNEQAATLLVIAEVIYGIKTGDDGATDSFNEDYEDGQTV